ncbi:hypothetical protein Tco_0360844 [Tanacetum coccineum]
MAKQQQNKQQERPDEELVPVTKQVKIGLSNYKIALEKQQLDVIYRLCLAILKQFSFFNAFIATIDITPKVSDHPFVTPAHHDDIVSFINELRYPESLEQVSKMMLSDEIKASAEYSNYLAKYMGTQPVKGQVIEEIAQSEEVADTVDSEETYDEEEGRLNIRQIGIVIGRGVNKESDEETLDDSKKMKGIETLSTTAQFMPSDSSGSSSSESKDKEGFLSTDFKELKDQSDNERTNTDGSEKAEEEQAGEEQPVDDQAGRVHVEVHVPSHKLRKLQNIFSVPV